MTSALMTGCGAFGPSAMSAIRSLSGAKRTHLLNVSSSPVACTTMLLIDLRSRATENYFGRIWSWSLDLGRGV
jgi:hypothetical protein